MTHGSEGGIWDPVEGASEGVERDNDADTGVPSWCDIQVSSLFNRGIVERAHLLKVF